MLTENENKTPEQKIVDGAGEALANYYQRNKAQISHPALCSFCGGSISRRIKSPKRRAIINLPCGHKEGTKPRQTMNTKEGLL